MEGGRRGDYFSLITGRRVRNRRSCCPGRSWVPHPSIAIVKFWQGRVEVILRLLSVVSFQDNELGTDFVCRAYTGNCVSLPLNTN